MFNEQQRKYFISLSSTNSFSRTAEEFGVSRQAVSKCISSIEAQLGCRLLDRDRQTAALTESGKIVLEYMADSNDRLTALKKRLAYTGDDSSKTLNVGFQDYLTIDAGFPREFESRGSKSYRVNVDVYNNSPSVLLNYLATRQLDIVIIVRYLATTLDLFEVLELKRISLYLLVSLRNLKAVPDASAADFKGEPLIMARLKGESKAEFDERARRCIALCGLKPSRVIEKPNLDSAYVSVRMGTGILLCTPFSRFIDTYGVRAYDSGAEDDLICIWRKNDKNVFVKEYVEYLVNNYYSEGAGRT